MTRLPAYVDAGIEPAIAILVYRTRPIARLTELRMSAFISVAV
jgi:hypothetical protein